MSDDDTFNPAGESSAPRRKRPPVTIDLEAESSTTKPAPETEADVPAATDAAETAEPAAPPPPAYEPEVGVAEPTPALESTPRESAGARFVIPALAALGGGVIGGLLVALLSSSTGTDPVASASLDSRFAAVSARLDRVEAAASETASRPTATPDVDPARLASLEREIAALKEAAANAPAPVATTPAPDLGPLESRLAALEARPEAAPAAPAAPPVDLSPLQSRLDALTGRLDAVEAHPPADPKTEAAARVIAVTGLRQAATGSGPFTDELAAARALGGADDRFAALQPLAATGAPSKAELAASFPAVAEQIRIAAAKVDPGASLVDRLAASASSLVSVKPSGPMAGPSATAIVSRMEAAVKEGNLAEALREGEALDAIARAPLADWAAKAGNRITIDTALAGLGAANSPN
ncbi:COG4223 family protein [Kaistia nematophila]|uniref:Mitofilin family membrane protein n=1 Tax=Kaistia nematophila TaxID=2994654 RepID=A0A9X3E1L4_9HYPH|nr:mitofilin family membrane protein [Kaistia nematophila]MCX5570056.1 mitofilin family membrane protein [Kaistia nematophila]